MCANSTTVCFIAPARHLIYGDQCSSIPICSGLFDLKHQKSNPNSGCKESRSLNSLSFSSVQFSRSVLSNSLWPHGLQYARPPCTSPLLEFTQTYVHWVSNAIQPTHPLSYPTPPTFNLSKHQKSFQMSQLFDQVAKVLEFQLQQ